MRFGWVLEATFSPVDVTFNSGHALRASVHRAADARDSGVAVQVPVSFSHVMRSERDALCMVDLIRLELNLNNLAALRKQTRLSQHLNTEAYPDFAYRIIDVGPDNETFALGVHAVVDGDDVAGLYLHFQQTVTRNEQADR